MAMQSWLSRWFGRPYRTSARGGRRAKLKSARRAKQPRLSLEALEERSLLSAPGLFTLGQFKESGAGQFDCPSHYSHSALLGGDFNVNPDINIGDVASGFGAQLHFLMAGKAGVNAHYDVGTGTVDAEYDNVRLNQNYIEPTQFNQQVTFSPYNTNVSYG